MSDDLSIDKIIPIINLQKRYRFLKNEINNMNEDLIFYKNILMSMVNNLSYFNNIRFFQDQESVYIGILNELKQIKYELDKFSNSISFKSLRNISINLLISELYTIKKLIIKYINHISPDNLKDVFNLLDNNWDKYITNNDREKINFLFDFFRPICIWDSDEHKKEVILNTIESDNKKNNISKDLFETLFIMKKQDDSRPPPLVINKNDSTPFTGFLKSISDIIDSPKKQKLKRVNNYDINDCIDILENDNIKITKNQNSISLLEDRYGATVYIKIKEKIIVIQGLFKDDLLNMSISSTIVKEKIKEHQYFINLENISIPKKFKDSYINIINLRDLISSNSNELSEEIRKKYNDFKNLQTKPLVTLVNEFLMASKYRKVDILTLLLISNEDDRKLAYIIFDIFKNKDKRDIATEIYNSLHCTVRELLDLSKKNIELEETELLKLNESDIPYERRINILKIDEDIKAKAMEKLKSIKNSFQGDNKAQQWLDGLLKIPFGIYKENEIIAFKENFIKKIEFIDSNIKISSDYEIDNYIKTLQTNKFNDLISEWNNYKINKKDYLLNVRKILDETVYGHNDAKTQLQRIFGQWINGKSKGAVLGLQGPPGTGKTSLIKNGLSKCLIDRDGKSRPFAFLPIGGSVNGSTLVGHNFTYVSSSWGRIVDILMTSKCMNPIIFIDEIDKVSNTEHGKEIISILTHLTDSTQNDEFEDKYYAGIKLDLSKALIVFSFNDPSLIDPILKDRITIIETNPLTIIEKLKIIKDYILPEVLVDVGFNKGEIIFDDQIIKSLVETYTLEAGVRKIKEIIIEIVRDININRFQSNEFEIPYKITEEYINQLFERRPKIRYKKVCSESSVGVVNGLYATSSGIGGITKIQTVKFPSDKMFDLHITGQAGNIMKESVEYALKNAFRLLSKEEQDQILENSNNKKAFGIHIHFPEAATPKDGPSAGLAITLAFYSLLTDRKVHSNVAMTGEIDLYGNAGIIGGLSAKLHGAKKAGCKLALIPEDNLEDLEIMRKEKNSPEDDKFKVVSVRNIHDIIKYCLE